MASAASSLTFLRHRPRAVLLCVQSPSGMACTQPIVGLLGSGFDGFITVDLR